MAPAPATLDARVYGAWIGFLPFFTFLLSRYRPEVRIANGNSTALRPPLRGLDSSPFARRHGNPQVAASPIPFSLSLAALIRSESRLNYKISFRDTGKSHSFNRGARFSNASSIYRYPFPILAGQRRVTAYETYPMNHFDQTEQALDELRYVHGGGTLYRVLEGVWGKIGVAGAPTDNRTVEEPEVEILDV